ncbi:hypothetical protein K3U93_17705 [Mycobacterium malmoense]|uniref:hypothetical protein n=1 Tax=Mycobacterium malmoense TaxID=1780 RepID=UPI0009F48623|nr:hypothetical protein [Mycobacterium malmoense]QZA16494.1 hypothetical protein K3U93_17705 [Mycobacterium malmoense]UNB93296.1 hypothetical protein H5T25_17690 [Mycobacterium malmoense]
MLTAAAAPHDLAALLPSWQLAMHADRKASYTIDSYLRGARHYLTWRAVEPNGHPYTRPTVQCWTIHLLDFGAQPASTEARRLGQAAYETDRSGRGRGKSGLTCGFLL